MTSSPIDHLYTRGKWGQGLSLHRNCWLHSTLRCADWLNRQNAIKITGSNGKGSTVQFTGAILNALGFKTGCFTSPHLFDIAERIRIGSEDVPRADLEDALRTVLSLVDTYERKNPKDTFGTFEILTAAALIAFESHNCNALVIEAGVGGRLDVTRLIPGSVTAITSIDLEHQAILGPTREHILYDKADLCPAGGTLVSGLLPGDLETRLKEYLALTGSTPVFLRDACSINKRKTTTDFHFKNLDLENVQLRAIGDHQVNNAAQSICLAHAWLEKAAWSWNAEAFADACRQALTTTQPPLRLEQIGTDPIIIADVCHSPDAAQKAADAITQYYPDAKITLVTGSSENKDARGILNALAPTADQIICTQARTMGRAAQDIAAQLPPTHAASVETHADLRTALTRAKEIAQNQNGIVLIAGGLFLAAEAVACLRGQNPETLKFL